MERHAASVNAPALDRFQQRALMIGAIGLLAGIVGGFIDRPSGEPLVLGLSPNFFRAWLMGFLVCTGLTLGSLGWTMLHHMTGGQWGLVSRRIWEAAMRALPVVALFFLLVLRPGQKRQERERQQLLNSLKKNDKVITTAGIYGTVVSVSDKEDEVIVKVDDNTRLKMLKSSIHRNITAEETAKAEADKAKEAK